MRFYRSAISTLLFVLLFTAFAFAQVTVSFIDVGQGDSILIQAPGETAILIDGGIERAGRVVVGPYLQAQGVTELTAIIATHPHADHIGGLLPIIENFPVKRVYADAQVHTTRTYERFLQSIDQRDIPFYMARAGMNLAFSGIDEFVILHPQAEFLSGLNNNSVVIWMRVGEVSFLFTGDIEKGAEEVLVNSGLVRESTVLKVAHHGSSTSTSEQFLAAVSPDIGVIMVGEDNTYAHPSISVLVRMDNLDVYRTDFHGTVEIITDGQSLQVETYKSVVDQEHRINLTVATEEQLILVPGIGLAIASRIIDYREVNGFSQVEDLINVSGIGVATLERIRDYFYIE